MEGIYWVTTKIGLNGLDLNLDRIEPGLSGVYLQNSIDSIRGVRPLQIEFRPSKFRPKQICVIS
jgi:hypothetical protein